MDEQIIERKKTAIRKAIDQLRPQLLDLAARIHEHPETKFEEIKASHWLSEAAREAGFKVEKPVGGLDTAFRATYVGDRGEDGSTVAFLAEYDALPKMGHACGHNLSGTASLGAALGLAREMGDLPGCIQLIGTPGEEGGGGKVILTEAGIFDGIDAAMMFHPSGKTVLWRYALARHKLSIEFFGKSSHAAGSPEKGINALDATIQTFNSINALRQHITDDARIHGIIIDGGESPNIVPDRSEALFYVRALDDGYCDELLERVKDCARGAATATGARVQLELQGSYKSLRPNMTLARTFKQNLEALGWEFDDVDPKEGIGSTDMGHVSHVVPVIHPYLSIGPADLAGHSTEFVEAANSEKGKEAMLAAAKAMATTVLEILVRPSLFEELYKEFRGGK
jgi:amidohydrolase